MARKPRLLFIGPLPPPYSGPEMVTKMLIDSSLSQRFSISFICTNVRTSNESKARINLEALTAFSRFFFCLMRELIRFSPEVVYYPVTQTAIGWVGRDAPCLLLCSLFGAKIVIHLHGGHMSLNFTRFHRPVKALVRVACRRVSLGLVLSPGLVQELQFLLPRARVDASWQPINTQEYSNTDLSSYDETTVLFMGHLTHAKGYCDLVRCIPKVAARFPAVRFLFAGTMRRGERGVFFNQATGEPLVYQDPVEIHEWISNGPYAKNYSYLGIISGEHKLATLQRCALFVSPSYSEGLSLSLLEAMSVGKPVICTRVGSHPEVVREGRNGYVVDPGDIASLTDKIISLLENKELREGMAAENFRYIRAKHDSGLVAERIGELIMSVA